MNHQPTITLKTIIDAFEIDTIDNFYQRDVVVEKTRSALISAKSLMEKLSLVSESNYLAFIDELKDLGCSIVDSSFQKKNITVNIYGITYIMSWGDEASKAEPDNSITRICSLEFGVCQIVTDMLMDILVRNFNSVCFSSEEYQYIRSKLTI